MISRSNVLNGSYVGKKAYDSEEISSMIDFYEYRFGTKYRNKLEIVGLHGRDYVIKDSNDNSFEIIGYDILSKVAPILGLGISYISNGKLDRILLNTSLMNNNFDYDRTMEDMKLARKAFSLLINKGDKLSELIKDISIYRSIPEKYIIPILNNMDEAIFEQITFDDKYLEKWGIMFVTDVRENGFKVPALIMHDKKKVFLIVKDYISFGNLSDLFDLDYYNPYSYGDDDDEEDYNDAIEPLLSTIESLEDYSIDSEQFNMNFTYKSMNGNACYYGKHETIFWFRYDDFAQHIVDTMYSERKYVKLLCDFLENLEDFSDKLSVDCLYSSMVN